MFGIASRSAASLTPRLSPSSLSSHIKHTRRIPLLLDIPVKRNLLLLPPLASKDISISGENEVENKENEMRLPDDNFAKRLYSKFFSGIPTSKLRASGYILLSKCTQTTDLESFFSSFSMPDTFYSWFLVTELHVWMIGARVMREGQYGRVVRNSLVEALWQDCDLRAKSIGDMSTSTRTKNIHGMAEEFQAALFVYDEGFCGSDMQLAGALHRRFFLSMGEAEEGGEQVVERGLDPVQIELLVSYVRRVMKYLDSIEGADLIVKCNVQWPPLIEK